MKQTGISIFLFLATLAMLVSIFIPKRKEDEQPRKIDNPLNIAGIEIYTITIEDCEYLQVCKNIEYRNAIFSVTHKGNCKNPIHKK